MTGRLEAVGSPLLAQPTTRGGHVQPPVHGTFLFLTMQNPGFLSESEIGKRSRSPLETGRWLAQARGDPTEGGAPYGFTHSKKPIASSSPRSFSFCSALSVTFGSRAGPTSTPSISIAAFAAPM